MKLLIRQNIQQIMTKLDIISLQLQVTFSEHKQALNIVASNHKICRDILIITVREKTQLPTDTTLIRIIEIKLRLIHYI